MEVEGGRTLIPEQKSNVPSRAGSRPWRNVRKQRFSSAVNVKSLKVSLERRKELRAKQKALSAYVKSKKDEENMAKEAERERIREKKKKKEENRQRSAKGQMITNPKTLKKMSKKQLKKLVRV